MKDVSEIVVREKIELTSGHNNKPRIEDYDAKNRNCMSDILCIYFGQINWLCIFRYGIIRFATWYITVNHVIKKTSCDLTNGKSREIVIIKTKV